MSMVRMSDRERPRPPRNDGYGLPTPDKKSKETPRREAGPRMPFIQREESSAMPKWMEQFPNARKMIAIRGPMPDEFAPGIGPENYIDYFGPQPLPYIQNPGESFIDRVQDPRYYPNLDQARLIAMMRRMQG